MLVIVKIIFYSFACFKCFILQHFTYIGVEMSVHFLFLMVHISDTKRPTCLLKKTYFIIPISLYNSEYIDYKLNYVVKQFYVH